MIITIPDFKQRLQQLLACASVSSSKAEWDMSNMAVIHLLADWFGALGFSCEIQQITDNKANLIACLGQGTGGLVLSGHTDTVPFNENRWQFNPLAATEHNNRFYGLGSADMKSFFSLIIEAVLPLLEQNFKQPLIVLASCDEESSMNGARALSAGQFHQARAAIIGEPTNLKPIYMHKGILMQRLLITGQSGHSSNPALGKSALDAMQEIMASLIDLRKTLQKTWQNPAFEVSYPTLNLGHIHGGDSPNRICNHCELHFDFRTLPGMQSEDIVHLILQHIQPIVEKHQVHLVFEPLFANVESFAEDKHSELVQLAEKLTHSSAQAVAFATEAPFLKQLGMQTIVLGPGSIDQAHQPDEFIAFEQINPAVQLLRQFIQHYCL